MRVRTSLAWLGLGFLIGLCVYLVQNSRSLQQSLPVTEQPMLERVEARPEQADAEPKDVPLSSAGLVVRIVGCESEEGQIRCALFADEASFERRSDPARTAGLSASRSAVDWTVDDLPAGRYAVAAYHDANGNGQLDKHAIGVPLEAYGFSRGARGKLGPPRFADAAFQYDGGPLQLSVELRSLLP